MARIAQAARQLLPEAGSPAITLLTDEDACWYGHHQARRLPVLRIAFTDPNAAWFQIDPATGEILNRADRSARVRRWLFNGLHAWDFGFLLRHRPALGPRGLLPRRPG